MKTVDSSHRVGPVCVDLVVAVVLVVVDELAVVVVIADEVEPCGGKLCSCLSWRAAAATAAHKTRPANLMDRGIMMFAL